VLTVESAVLCGVSGYVAIAPLRTAANVEGFFASTSSTIADARVASLEPTQLEAGSNTAVGIADGEPLSASLIDYDTVWADDQSLQDAQNREHTP
jgi:hypothetical protein